MDADGLLRAVVEFSAQGVVVVADSGRIVSINPLFLDLNGLPVSACGPGDSVDMLFQHDETLRDHLMFEDGVMPESFRHLPDGRIVSLRSGRLPGSRVICVCAEVSECPQVDERRQTKVSEARLRDFSEATADYFSEMDEHLRFTYVSESVLEAFGVDAAEILGKSRWQIGEILPSEEAAWEAHRATLAAGRPFRDFEYSFYDAGGNRRWIRLSGKPFFDANKVFKGYRTAGTDITAEKRTQQRLRESETQLRLIIDSLPFLVVYADTDLRCHYVNATAERWYARPANKIVGCLLEEIRGEEATARLRSALKDAVAGQHVTYEVQTTYPDGETRDVEVQFVPHRDETGAVVGVLAIAIDATERKSIAAQLQQAQKMEAVGQLTGGVAHDFNNLLTVVMGNLQLLERRLKGDARTEKQIGMALDAVHRGAELTRRLLAFSRRQVLAPEHTVANSLVDGMVPLIRRTVGEAIRLDTKQDRSPWTTRIDVAQFESALLNLAVNARDAMPKGGLLLIETRNVTIDARYASTVPGLEPGDYVSVSVSDTGTGIPKDILDRVFEPFFTTKEVGKGSGLGLSMVYGFVKQSKGHVTIYSEEGQGTTIRLYFPRSVEGNADAVAHEIAAEAPGGSETILIVEDEQAVRETLALMLEDSGYTVMAAEDGPSALATLQAGVAVELLLTDVVMSGGMNGREVAERALKLRPGLKVLITSGYPQETISHNGILDDGIAFIGKPYEHGDLARKIREVLDG